MMKVNANVFTSKFEEKEFDVSFPLCRQIEVEEDYVIYEKVIDMKNSLKIHVYENSKITKIEQTYPEFNFCSADFIKGTEKNALTKFAFNHILFKALEQIRKNYDLIGDKQ